MSEPCKKRLRIIGLILFGLGIIAGIIMIFAGDKTLNNWGTITCTASASLELSVAVSLNFDIRVSKTINNIKNEFNIKIEEEHKQINEIKNEFNIRIEEEHKQINNIKNEYKVKFEDNQKSITNLINELNVKKYQINKIENHYNQLAKQPDNPDDELYKEMKNLYEPIEEFLVANGGFGAPFIIDPFFDLAIFADSCTMNRFKFIDESLKTIHEQLKIYTCELVRILSIYSYPMQSNQRMSKFEYLDIMNKISYMPEAYSIAKIQEHKAKFNRANELLKDIVEQYRALDDKYKELRFKK